MVLGAKAALLDRLLTLRGMGVLITPKALVYLVEVLHLHSVWWNLDAKAVETMCGSL